MFDLLAQPNRGLLISAFKVISSLLLGGTGLWLVTRGTAPAAIWAEAVNASWIWVVGGVAVILATIMAKAWRWRLLFFPRSDAPPYQRLLNGIILGQFFNQLLPVARLGDIVRILSLPAEIQKGRILGTLVLEKTLDTIMMVATLFLLLPFVVIPDVVNNPTVLGSVAAAFFILLYLLAFQSGLIIRLTRWAGAYLPDRPGRWLVKLVTAGLAGLAALKDRRAAAALVFSSVVIALLSVLTPFLLFLAFHFPLSFAAAAALNLAIMIGSLPSSAPANIGVFEFLAVVSLQQLGPDLSSSALLSYAFVYHLVVIGPVIILGTFVLLRQEWPFHYLQQRLAHAAGKSAGS